MLVLSRKVGDSIIIDDDIEITVLSIKADQVKIGIDAPQDVEVHRHEVYDRLIRQRDYVTQLSQRSFMTEVNCKE